MMRYVELQPGDLFTTDEFGLLIIEVLVSTAHVVIKFVPLWGGMYATIFHCDSWSMSSHSLTYDTDRIFRDGHEIR